MIAWARSDWERALARLLPIPGTSTVASFIQVAEHFDQSALALRLG
jgi:hypothetical protein